MNDLYEDYRKAREHLNSVQIALMLSIRRKVEEQLKLDREDGILFKGNNLTFNGGVLVRRIEVNINGCEPLVSQHDVTNVELLEMYEEDYVFKQYVDSL
jgi:hypothetical protein